MLVKCTGNAWGRLMRLEYCLILGHRFPAGRELWDRLEWMSFKPLSEWSHLLQLPEWLQLHLCSRIHRLQLQQQWWVCQQYDSVWSKQSMHCKHKLSIAFSIFKTVIRKSLPSPSVPLSPSFPQNTHDGYTCVCDPDFTGRSCEVSINECSPELCQNGGTCFVSDVNVYTKTKSVESTFQVYLPSWKHCN